MTTPNAPNVKRYNFCNFEKSGPEMQQAPEGEWVFYADLHAAEARATAAEARCKVLEKALKWYASDAPYGITCASDGWGTPTETPHFVIEEDRGARARAALRKDAATQEDHK